MPASENRSLGQSTNDGVYVKTDLYPSSTLDDGCVRDDGRHHHDHDDDQPPVLKIARYAISPSPILSSNHQNGYAFDSHLTSPIPRRKQARPRRRSGDSSTSPPLMMMEPLFKPFASTPSPVQDMPEDLSIKKSPNRMSRQESEDHSARSNDQDSRSDTPLPVPSNKSESVNSDSAKSEYSLTERNNLFSPGPSGSSGQLSGLPLAAMNMSTMSPTTNSLLSLTPIHQSDRRKGQHSAPRGGPPRAWTNGDLTEALNHVWNRKMTTSQASRVFGIPYNSLLMYVRGKYGKSLKLDTLRKETLEGEAMALAASTRGSYKLAAVAAAAAAASSPPTNGKSGKNNGNNGTSDNSNKSTTTTTTGSTTPNASPKNATIANNNNNNNNSSTDNRNNNSLIKNNNTAATTGSSNLNKNSNNNGHNGEVKATKNLAPVLPSHLNLPGAYPPHHLNEMEALSMAGLAAAGLGGFGGVNPYLSYFCDFSFPLPMGLAGLMQPSAALPTSKHHRVADTHHKKTSSGKMSKHRAKGTAKSEFHHLSDTDTKEDTDGDNNGSSPLPLHLSRALIQTPRDRSQTGQV